MSGKKLWDSEKVLDWLRGQHFMIPKANIESIAMGTDFWDATEQDMKNLGWVAVSNIQELIDMYNADIESGKISSEGILYNLLGNLENLVACSGKQVSAGGESAALREEPNAPSCNSPKPAQKNKEADKEQ